MLTFKEIEELLERIEFYLDEADLNYDESVVLEEAIEIIKNHHNEVYDNDRSEQERIQTMEQIEEERKSKIMVNKED